MTGSGRRSPLTVTAYRAGRRSSPPEPLARAVVETRMARPRPSLVEARLSPDMILRPRDPLEPCLVQDVEARSDPPAARRAGQDGAEIHGVADPKSGGGARLVMVQPDVARAAIDGLERPAPVRPAPGGPPHRGDLAGRQTREERKIETQC